VRTDDRGIHHRRGVRDDHAVAHGARMDDAVAATVRSFTDHRTELAVGDMYRRPPRRNMRAPIRIDSPSARTVAYARRVSRGPAFVRP